MRWLVFLLMFSGCQDDLGAVSVRWEIVDLTRGDYLKPNDFAGPNGSCERTEPDMSQVTSWRIARVRLVLTEITDGGVIDVLPRDDKRLLFKCSAREAVTPFSLPLGTFAMSLRAVDDAGEDDPNVVTPAPAVHTIKRAEVVNLDVVELGIHPQPRAPILDMAVPDGGLDLAVPDGGPVM